MIFCTVNFISKSNLLWNLNLPFPDINADVSCAQCNGTERNFTQLGKQQNLDLPVLPHYGLELIQISPSGERSHLEEGSFLQRKTPLDTTL